MGLASSDSGRCASCGATGTVGERCQERVCQRRAYRFIPAAHAEKQLGREPGKVEPLVGTLLGDYLVVDLVGQGGFGKVYLALQTPIRKRPLKVAVKVMEVGDAPTVEALERLIEKFEGEADALAALTHPNIVRLLKYGLQGQTPYIAMEYVSGARSLRQEIVRRAVRREPFLLSEVADILRQVTHGLEAAHEQDIVHRDVKPDNVMLQDVAGNALFVRILDFGLAKFVDERSRTSVAVGTPTTMAPEQLLKDRIGPWTDIYAVGVMAFELLTGQRAFQGTYQEIYRQKADPHHDPVTALEGRGLPPLVLATLRKAMAYEPEQRHASMAELRLALDAAVASLGSSPEVKVAIDVGALVASGELREAGLRSDAVGEATPAHPEYGPAAFGVEPTTPARLPDAVVAQAATAATPAHLAVAPAPTSTAEARAQATTASLDDAPPKGGSELTFLSPGRRRIRTAALVAVVLAVFLLALSYSSLGKEPVAASFRVMSGPVARPNASTVLRVLGTAADGHTPLGVDVLDGEVAGERGQLEVEGTNPAHVRVWIPGGASDSVPIRLWVRADGSERALDLVVPVDTPATPAAPPIQESVAAELGSGQELMVLPDGQRLVVGLSNRIDIRLRDAAGNPVALQPVRIIHPSFEDGVILRTTEANGLLSFSMDVEQTWYRLRLEIGKGKAMRVEEVTLGARGRQMLVKPNPAVTRPGESPRVKLTTWRQEGEVFCELLHGQGVLWGRSVRTTNHIAWLEPGPLEPGRYDLQCYDHPTRPDEAYATTPVIVAEGDPLAATLAAVRAAGPPPGAALTAVPGGKDGMAVGYWLAVMQRPLVAPKLRLATHEADVAAASEAQSTSRMWVLAGLAAVVALLLAWLADGILKSFIESRERLRAQRSLSGEDADAEPVAAARLRRLRGVLLAVLVGGAAIVTITAIVLVFLFVV